jgi:hypothetical protein
MVRRGDGAVALNGQGRAGSACRRHAPAVAPRLSALTLRAMWTRLTPRFAGPHLADALFVLQRPDRIDTRRPARGHERGEQRGERQHERSHGECDDVRG